MEPQRLTITLMDLQVLSRGGRLVRHMLIVELSEHARIALADMIAASADVEAVAGPVCVSCGRPKLEHQRMIVDGSPFCGGKKHTVHFHSIPAGQEQFESATDRPLCPWCGEMLTHWMVSASTHEQSTWYCKKCSPQLGPRPI